QSLICETLGERCGLAQRHEDFAENRRVPYPREAMATIVAIDHRVGNRPAPDEVRADHRHALRNERAPVVTNDIDRTILCEERLGFADGPIGIGLLGGGKAGRKRGSETGQCGCRNRRIAKFEVREQRAPDRWAVRNAVEEEFSRHSLSPFLRRLIPGRSLAHISPRSRRSWYHLRTFSLCSARVRAKI